MGWGPRPITDSSKVQTANAANKQNLQRSFGWKLPPRGLDRKLPNPTIVCAAGAKTESKNTDEILPRRVIEEMQKLKPEDTHPASVHAYQKNPGVLLKTHKFLYLAHDEFKRSLENISRSILKSFFPPPLLLRFSRDHPSATWNEIWSFKY